MKKGLLTFSAIIALTFSNKVSAQLDTLNEFFIGTLANYGVGPLPDAGYVAGNNTYGDLAKMMLFDDTHGVYYGGTITGVLVGISNKVNAGGSFKVAIWNDVNGAPGANPIASKTLTVAEIDTANYQVVGDIGFYNVDVTFNTPIAIPTNKKFWAGVILPTSAGDTIALFTNTEGDFPEASAYTGEIQYDGGFKSLNDGTNATWQLDVALSVFPKVNFVNTTGINENEIVQYEVFPNPANDVLNFKLKENCKSIEILSLDGKTVALEVVSGMSVKLNISNLNSGVYIFKLTNDKGLVSTNKFVKK